jgi:CheY-like chemotaxis protein
MATTLVVNDEKPVREFLVAAFEQEGHEVLEAWHGRHALALIHDSTRPPDLVISDVMMPLVGGFELCRLLRADPSTADIPIILMSATHRKARAGAAADAVIGKPFDLDTLEALAHQLLANRHKGAA